MKLIHIVGNRPQFIKLALLHRALEQKTGTGGRIIHTGQHYSEEMSAIFFSQLQIPAPDYQLGIRQLSHNSMIGNMLIGLDPLLDTEKPDCVVVYGDTNTTLAGALAAKKRNIPLAHIEAGIRTGKEDMPEESNRYLSDRVADLNFTCTPRGVENLLAEGFPPGRIHHTGDLMLDAALLFMDPARNCSSLLRELSLQGYPFILATIHRAENIEDPSVFRRILDALEKIHMDIPVLFPMHPRTRQVLDSLNRPLRLISTPPLGYLDMLALTQDCHAVITDSRGLSREAFFFKKPSLVIMQNPFWPEIFQAGPSLQAKAETQDILLRFAELESSGKPFLEGVFGDGFAAEKISDILSDAF